jgi:hypothetical protein
MSATFNLFERWKTLKGHSSAMAACAALGVERQAATYWKDGRNAEAHIIERMANDLGENATGWVLAAAAEKTRAAAEKRTLLRLAKTLGYAATICLAVYASIPAAIAMPMDGLQNGDVLGIAHVLIVLALGFASIRRFLRLLRSAISARTTSVADPVPSPERRLESAQGIQWRRASCLPPFVERVASVAAGSVGTGACGSRLRLEIAPARLVDVTRMARLLHVCLRECTKSPCGYIPA